MFVHSQNFVVWTFKQKKKRNLREWRKCCGRRVSWQVAKTVGTTCTIIDFSPVCVRVCVCVLRHIYIHKRSPPCVSVFLSGVCARTHVVRPGRKPEKTWPRAQIYSGVLGRRREKKRAKTLTSLNTRSHFLFRVEENNQKKSIGERDSTHTVVYETRPEKRPAKWCLPIDRSNLQAWVFLCISYILYMPCIYI